MARIDDSLGKHPASLEAIWAKRDKDTSLPLTMRILKVGITELTRRKIESQLRYPLGPLDFENILNAIADGRLILRKGK